MERRRWGQQDGEPTGDIARYEEKTEEVARAGLTTLPPATESTRFSTEQLRQLPPR